ncbi:MAG: sigma-54-dependent Fis family transcriptional regulator, partial [Nitrospirae bacterium]|nr:sigma-54-dependent Fis family transcriptional regulator [Nitrospirota bacterium]
VEAMKLGAYDYIQKPFEPENLLLVVKKALDYQRLMEENRRLYSELESCRSEELIGSSRSIREVKQLIEKIAPLDTTAIIEGETGTGKGLVARIIHKLSKRAAKKFLSINCGAVTETLLESELFGHEKGAFTGAIKQKEGYFEAAHGGTLFLDEINNAGQGMQVKLLKVLEEGKIMRIGSAEPVPVDVRIIAASNLPLKKEVDDGKFRQDLYYRLKVVTITMPSLRERRDDIPLLAHHFLSRYCERFSKEIHGFTTEAMDTLLTYDWPGNVRELEHVIERAVILEHGKKIGLSSLPAELRSRPKEMASPKGIMRLEDMEKQLIQSALRFFNGKRDSSARALGISPATLWRKLKKYNLS